MRKKGETEEDERRRGGANICKKTAENQTCVYRCQNHWNEGGIYHHVYIEYKLLNKKNKNKK